ncbi:glucose-1-phosphate thymidylyltransferase RfbA [Streptomyces sp. NPDC058045]|uniref:glucose-1-phosphate thymidylyltransferase RfbA n=1 Tax=Streptomyces sp. NPDC058045 TaxID=3346311 RepID=UPI0036E5A052
MKGILLAGGSGTRLYPATSVITKHLLPVAAKPMIFYPLTVLMLAGIRDILIISSPHDLPRFRALFKDGSHLGLNISYAEQREPKGIAEALLIGADHIRGESSVLALGDNIFHGHHFSDTLQGAAREVEGCVLFGYPVHDPERYGVGETDGDGRLVSIEEKPEKPRSNRAITGLYMYDHQVLDIAKNIRPSARGELEITDVNREYLARGQARLINLGRGFAWLDTGTPEALMQAGLYVQTMEERQGVRIACPEEVALRMGFIDLEQCHRLGRQNAGSAYGQYLLSLVPA